MPDFGIGLPPHHYRPAGEIKPVIPLDKNSLIEREFFMVIEELSFSDLTKKLQNLYKEHGPKQLVLDFDEERKSVDIYMPREDYKMRGKFSEIG